MKETTVKRLWIAFIALIAIILAQNMLIIYTAQTTPATEGAALVERQAVVSACINRHPYWLNPVVCEDAYTGTQYSCNVSAIDRDGHNVSTYTAWITEGNLNGSRLLTNISSDGILTFTAYSNETGEYNITVQAADDTSCPLTNQTSFLFSVHQNNNSPILTEPIPDSTWGQDTMLIPYNLNNYFTDPDGDNLAYRVTGNTQIRITISQAGEVTLDPEQDFCGVEIVNYIATDPTNLSVTSNDVTLTVECASDDTGDTATSTSGGGGGGGGGGTSTSSSCIESYHCYEWSKCQYTKAVTEDGDKLNITGVLGTRSYTVEGTLTEDSSVLYQGYQWRECIDTNKCEARSKFYARSCEYSPNCYDHIQNQDETGVDCGGVCGPCGSCEDGIQNGLEEGIDCGGPECKECNTCTDGVLNGKELAVDCGGPDCPACETCFDGIQNQDETGVDCGGSCSACSQLQVPAIVTDSKITMALLILLVLAAATVVLMWVFRRKLAEYLSKAALKYQRTDRIILLTREVREQLLEELSEIVSEPSNDPLKQQARIGTLVRKYLHQAVGTSIEANQEDVRKALQAANLHELLAQVLEQLFVRASQIEFSRVAVMPSAVESMLAEMEATIHETSAYNAQDLRHARLEHATRPRELPGAAGVYSRIVAAYSHIKQAKMLTVESLYTEAGRAYQALTPEQQRSVYPDLSRLHTHILFSTAYSKSLLGKSRQAEGER